VDNRTDPVDLCDSEITTTFGKMDAPEWHSLVSEKERGSPSGNDFSQFGGSDPNY
jgi:hypothetical protein